MITISSNTLILNEIENIDGLIKNLIDAHIDEIIFLDGGSTDGSYEKLLEYEKKHSFIKAMRWKQPDNSEFKSGFRESDRRNIMKMASSSEYIFYIDADERVSTNLKKEITDKNKSAYIIKRYHFWGKNIRVNSSDDRVWLPEYQFRVIKNSKNIEFKSKEKNGLHNRIYKNGFRVIGSFNSGVLFKNIARVINNSIIGFSSKKLESVEIYHLHYLNLEKKGKRGDLRTGDIENGKVILVENLTGGLIHNRKKEHVICCLKDEEIYNKMLKYM